MIPLYTTFLGKKRLYYTELLSNIFALACPMFGIQPTRARQEPVTLQTSEGILFL